MSINTRTVFYDLKNGIMSFWDWALVGTDLGTMVEPYDMGRHAVDTPAIEFDSTDEMVKITEIRAMDRDKEQLILSGGNGHLNGGALIPRTGR